MSTAFEVPLINRAQRLSVTLNQVTYIVTVVWNTAANCWVADFADEDGNPLLQGVPLVANVDLFQQFDYLDFGGQLVSQTDHSPDTPPTYSNLGTTGHLYYVLP